MVRLLEPRRNSACQLAYYLASEMLANSGQVFDLNPAVVSWLPTGALLLVTVVALARIR